MCWFHKIFHFFQLSPRIILPPPLCLSLIKPKEDRQWKHVFRVYFIVILNLLRSAKIEINRMCLKEMKIFFNCKSARHCKWNSSYISLWSMAHSLFLILSLLTGSSKKGGRDVLVSECSWCVSKALDRWVAIPSSHWSVVSLVCTTPLGWNASWSFSHIITLLPSTAFISAGQWSQVELIRHIGVWGHHLLFSSISRMTKQTRVFVLDGFATLLNRSILYQRTPWGLFHARARLPPPLFLLWIPTGVKKNRPSFKSTDMTKFSLSFVTHSWAPHATRMSQTVYSISAQSLFWFRASSTSLVFCWNSSFRWAHGSFF